MLPGYYAICRQYSAPNPPNITAYKGCARVAARRCDPTTAPSEPGYRHRAPNVDGQRGAADSEMPRVPQAGTGSGQPPPADAGARTTDSHLAETRLWTDPRTCGDPAPVVGRVRPPGHSLPAPMAVLARSIFWPAARTGTAMFFSGDTAPYADAFAPLSGSAGRAGRIFTGVRLYNSGRGQTATFFRWMDSSSDVMAQVRASARNGPGLPAARLAVRPGRLAGLRQVQEDAQVGGAGRVVAV